MKIPLSKGDWRRGVAKASPLGLVNRYFEENPVLSEDGSAYLRRPALRRFLEVGEGPIRHIYSQPGSFDDALFVMSGEQLYRVTKSGEVIYMDQDYQNLGGGISMAATSRLGPTGVPEYLFIADGQTLRVYDPDLDTVLQVETPDDVGIISVAFIASYIICVVAQNNGLNGRFYWIDPGDKTIEPLNFATAERAPDPVYQVVVFGDQFWLTGQTTTEVWYPTGDPLAPMQRLQGVVFDYGTVAGTALQVKDSMMIVDRDGGVFQIKGGMDKVSNPNIEQRIRNAIEIDNKRSFI